ncbi:3'-5' exonuclease [Lujinxingia litoralis]|uniref:3'-5' exonuclease n=1 Tax=Lujinxingia litoralis TaxID=2211119 RepID=A0A328CB00_9DELT|nr:3'-5' exonuclease [Lujinxingia litoralis]RAL22387.1 3'-5' exonuclease [Lujinxingia litoralis]
MSNWPELWKDLTLAVIDVETTGLDPQTDRVTEVGIIRFERGEVIETYGKLVHPGCPIPEDSTRITGISDDDVKDAPRFEEIAAEVHERLQGVGIVAYNLAFDRSFMRNELERCGLGWPDDAPTLDPLIFARQFYKNHPRKNLGAICKLLGIPLEEAHRATHDATVTGHVLYAFADRLPEQLDALLMLQAQWEQQQAAEMSGWRGRNRGGGGDFESLGDALGGATIGLGPAYIYGDEADPLRALYMSVPEAND